MITDIILKIFIYNIIAKIELSPKNKNKKYKKNLPISQKSSISTFETCHIFLQIYSYNVCHIEKFVFFMEFLS